MLQAKIIMKKDVVTVRPQDTLDQVIETLIDNNITGLPVINEDQTLAGIITEKDILRYLLEQDAIRHLTDSNLCEHTVFHVMTENVVTFKEDAELQGICQCLTESPFRRVPIVNSSSKLVGIISRRDIITVFS